MKTDTPIGPRALQIEARGMFEVANRLLIKHRLRMQKPIFRAHSLAGSALRYGPCVYFCWKCAFDV